MSCARRRGGHQGRDREREDEESSHGPAWNLRWLTGRTIQVLDTRTTRLDRRHTLGSDE